MAASYPHPVFGWDAARLSDLPLPALVELRAFIVENPANANPEHAAGRSIYLYTPSARRKLDALAWAVTHKLANARRAA